MNSFFSLKVGGRRAKPIVSRQKLVQRDKRIVVIVAAITAGVLTFSFLMGQRIVAINRKNNEVLNGPTTTAGNQPIRGLSEISERIKKNEEAQRILREGFDEFNNQRENRGWSQVHLACLPGEGCLNEDVVPVRTVLDALPSRYDHLVLRHQLQDFFNRHGFKPSNIEVPVQADEGAGDGSYQEIPLEISLEVDPAEAVRFIETLDRSIRPIVIRQVRLSQGSGSGKWSMTVAFTTYFQPEIELKFAEVIIPNQPSQPATTEAEE